MVAVDVWSSKMLRFLQDIGRYSCTIGDKVNGVPIVSGFFPSSYASTLTRTHTLYSQICGP